jgi:hypothetical protein
MATPSDVSVGLAHELIITSTKVGWEPKDFATLAHSEDKAREILAYLRGLSEITQISHVINCDDTPYIPQGWSVLPGVEQLPGRVRVFTWDPTKVKLYLSPGQEGVGGLIGNDLYKKLADRPVFGANVLDFLRKPENQHLIPEKFWNELVFFWGTIYVDRDGYRCVRCLCRRRGGWGWDARRLSSVFSNGNPALLCAR